jgi:SAM-dependent methyltransferase
LVDLGGGTGLPPQGASVRTYVCMDLDFAKLRRFRAGRSGRLAVVGDAAACPFAAKTFDAVLCAKVVHHLNDGALKGMLSESLRILKPGGVLILVDAVRTTRWTSRVLWRLDGGSCPRTAAEIRGALPAKYSIDAWEEFRIAPFHRFALCTARQRVQ